MRRPTRSLSLVLLAVAALACGSHEGPDLTLAPTDANVIGTFTLLTSNGHTLPVIGAFLFTDAQWDLTADRMVIAADNTWVETTTYKVTNLNTLTDSNQTTVASGTYSVNAGQIVFTMLIPQTTPPLGFTGSVTGNSLSVIFSGSRFFYSR